MNPDGRTLCVLPSVASILFRKPGFRSPWIHLALELVGAVFLCKPGHCILNESSWTESRFFFLTLYPEMVFSMEMLCLFAFSYLLSVSKAHWSPAGVLKFIFALLSLHVAPSLCSTFGHCRVICYSFFPSYWSHSQLQKKVGVLSRISCFQGWPGQGAASPSSLTLGNTSWVVATAVPLHLGHCISVFFIPHALVQPSN